MTKSYNYTDNDFITYISNGGSLCGSLGMYKGVTSEIVERYVRNGGDLSKLGAYEDVLSIDCFISRFKKTGDLFELDKKVRAQIPQELINQYAKNGGNLLYLSEEQIEALPQDIVNSCASMGCSLGLIDLDKRKSIPQENINQNYLNCAAGDRGYILAEQRKSIPQEIINQLAARGGDIFLVTTEQKKTFHKK